MFLPESLVSKSSGFLFVLFCSMFFSQFLWAEKNDDPQVEFFSPGGSVKDVRQVVVRFTQPMVAFGDPRLPDPFTIECPETGKGRWADARNWVYDFERDLPAGVQCTFTLQFELKALDGRVVSGNNRFSFDTGGPNVRVSMPYDGDEGIDERQIFVLGLDTPADPESVRAHAQCQVDGMADLMSVEVITGAERDEILAQKRLLGYSYYRLLWKSGRESMAMVSDDSFKRAEDELIVMRCQRPVPPGTRMQLVWGAGITSTSGVATQQAQALAYRTRDAFTVRFECQRTNAQAACIPVLPMRLVFTAPVIAELAAQFRLVSDNGKEYLPDTIDAKKTPVVDAVTFSGPFPESTKFKIHLPEKLQDDGGRRPENADRFPLDVATDESPPLAKFSSTFGIIELKEGGVLPVTLRNIEAPVAARKIGEDTISGKQYEAGESDASIAAWIRRVEEAMEQRGEWNVDEEGNGTWTELTGSESVLNESAEAQDFTIPKSGKGKTFEVVGIPLKKPGFYVVELASPKLGAALLGNNMTRYVTTTALVTNMAVHFKWGRESSVVWVTSLDQGEPVADAEIRISHYCDGGEVWQGSTGEDGTVTIPGTALPTPHSYSRCYDWAPSPLMVSARKADDLSFTLSAWGSGIQPYDFNLPTGYESQAYMAHTVLDRALFRAGETVSMKHFYRQHTINGIDIPAQNFNQMILQHEGSDQRFTVDITFDGQGSSESTWAIPQDAKLGTYNIMLYNTGTETTVRTTSFRVEQYRVPTMKALIQPPAAPLINAKSAEVDLYVSYLSGGGAANAPVKLRTLVEPKFVSFRDYNDYVFGGKDVQVGLHQDVQDGYDDLDYFRSRFGEYQQSGGSPATPAQVIPLTLDANGTARATIPDLPKVTEPKQILAELEYQDANGETLSVANRIALWPSQYNLGIRTEGWVASKDDLRVRVVALDLEGKPVVKKKISVDLFQTEWYSYRKRLIGGFYAYESTRETKALDQECSGVTDEQGLIFCEFEPGVSGSITIRARSTDDLGNQALSSRDTWLAGGDDWWFDVSDNDRMDVIPERNDYEMGETARFQVRMPFRSAQALVTIEREGVIDSFVTEISGKEPVIEIPIKPEYSPNVYVSVLALRGRVGWLRSWLSTVSRKLELPFKFDGGVPTALIDLSKPAYRLGIAQINTGWKPHRLDVAVTAEKEVYAVRDKAKIKIAVARADGGTLPDSAEVAIAAVDEGLLELMPNPTWALLDAMMGKRGIEVLTSTAQMQVVGKRHYGRKAVPHGGGGGRQTAREMFDTLLLWQGRVDLDDQGNAEIEVPLNDSLTSFRIVAIASAGRGHFGAGQTSIRTSQDLMLHSGLPQLVREGDQFSGIFTVRNASKRNIILTSSAELTSTETAETLPVQTLELAPGASGDVVWPVTVPINTASLAWEVSVTEENGSATDRLRVQQQVIPAHPVRTYQATLTRIEQPLNLLLERPHDAVPGRGGVNITLRSKLGDGLEGVREYMSFYPYTCYEQRVSQSIALRDEALWESVMRITPSYLDRDGLLRYFPAEWLQGDDTLTSYVLSVAHEAGWEIPDYERGRMLQGLAGFAAGHVQRDSALQTADLAIRKLAAIEAISRYNEVPVAVFDSITIEPNLWPTSAVLDWINILKRMPDIKDNESRMREAQTIIRSRLNFQGTTMGFSTEHTDALWWLMISSDVNAVRGVLNLIDQESWHEDIPRMVRGALGRQHRGHWNTTTANAWGVLAMEKFSEVFESVPVTGNTESVYAANAHTTDWAMTETEDRAEFPWSDTAETLSIAHAGTGVPWAIIQSRAAIPLREPLSSGYDIVRTITPIEQKQAGTWNRGDVARVRLEVDAQSDMTWVVVDDPVPSGASILGTGLGRDSTLLTQNETREGWVWPAFEERRFDAFRAYYHFVPKGKWIVEYTVRYNNPGTFELPATRVEAMYAPEMFGELPNDPVTIEAAP